MVPKSESDHKDLYSSVEQCNLFHNDPENTKTMDDHIEDSMVSGYVDPTLQLDATENARLVRKIHWQ